MTTFSPFTRVIAATLTSMSLWMLTPSGAAAAVNTSDVQQPESSHVSAVYASASSAGDSHRTVIALPGARLLDTRGPGTVDGLSAGGGAIPDGGVIFVPVAGRGGVPADAHSAMLSLVAGGATGTSHATLWPCESVNEPVPNSSVLNFSDGWTRANGVMVALGDTGGVCLYVFRSTHAVMDVQAYSTSQNLVTISPTRVADSRWPGNTMFAAGEVRRFDISSETGDAPSAYLNITSVGNTYGGFATIWPCDSVNDPMPDASVLNHVPNHAVANNTLTGLSNGAFCVYSSADAHIIVDLMGFLTVDANDLAAQTPLRVVDTRDSTGIAAQQTRRFNIGGHWQMPDDVSGVVANFTAVYPAGEGFLTVWACESDDETPPNTSMLNYGNDRWSATPNTSVQMLSSTGFLCVYSYAEVDLIIDVSATITDLFDSAYPLVDIGGGIVAYDMTTGRQNEFNAPLLYGLYFCDVTNIADTHDRWGDPWLIGEDPWAPDRELFTATNVAAYTQEAFNDITATLIEGRTSVTVTLRADLDADPETGSCEFDTSERPDNEGVIRVHSHWDRNARYSGSANYSIGRNASIRMNAEGWTFGGVLAHEFGHNLGWRHSNYTFENVDGRKSTYDSAFDIMGNGDGYVTTFDRLVQIGAISPHQLVGHNTGTTNATLAAHAHYTGTVAAQGNTRAVVISPTDGTYERAGSSVLLGIEAGIRYRNINFPQPGLVVNMVRSSGLVNGTHLLNAPMTSSHPVAPGASQWDDSFVAVGESRTFFGVTITVHGTNPDGTVNATITGELNAGQWEPAATAMLRSIEQHSVCGTTSSDAFAALSPEPNLGSEGPGVESKAVEGFIPDEDPETGDSSDPESDHEHGDGCSCGC